MPRIAPAIASLLLLCCAISCATGCATSRPPSVPAYEIRSRLRDVFVGQSIAEVHDIVGDEAVRRPGSSDALIPSPIRTIEFSSHAGQIRVEVYMVSAWRAESCTGFEYQDIPVSYVNGQVVSKEWNYLEWNWQRWGGSLASLRSAQDRYACP